LNQNDPTNHALAAIASLLDQPEPPAPPPDALSVPEDALDVPPAMESPPPPIAANGYSRVGPGPMAALRLKWTVREDSGRYYVDETIGENSVPMVSGPFDGRVAIKFVDDRERTAHRRFESLKREMTGRRTADDSAAGESNPGAVDPV
jgi:hypothetical protein